MKFKDFLIEKTEKHGVLAFGRMSPPTVGHSLVVDKVKEVAKAFNGSHHIVLSHTNDRKKNPLTPQQKLKHAKRFFPGANLSVSTPEAPTFLAQAAKLHKAGVTHLHMVAGSDRTDEYYKLLHKYNGVKGTHGQFDFKHIKVHSAGERDPDAEGVTGMSASKMRAHAQSGNFKDFKKGIPSHVKDEHAKELFQHVRQGMGLKEDINTEFEMLLSEGVHDKSIFKAVFLFGGPGSGKDFVLSKTLDGQGLTEINSDKAFEFLMDKNNLDMRMPENETSRRDVVRGKAKSMTELKQHLALFGRNGLIINGTGDDVDKIKKIKERLQDIGYESQAIMVNTDDEVSKQRNVERGQRGGRTVPEDIRKNKWDLVQSARPEYGKIFGDAYMEFDNSEDLRNSAPEVVQAKEKELTDLFKNVQKFVSKPPKNPSAQMWVASEMEKKDTFKVDKTKEVVPHEGSKAAEEARKLGLKYFGFGRYGIDGKVTHRSVHDKLVEVQPQQTKNTQMPVPGSSMKRVNEEFEMLEESVTVSITADTPEEINNMFSQMFNSSVQESKKNTSAFSTEDAQELLNLGRKTTVSEIRNDSITFSNDDVNKIMESNKDKYLTDNNGKIRVFMLRAAAAREAHQRNGGIVKKEKGYVIKLKENTNVQISKKYIHNEFGNTSIRCDFQDSRVLTEGIADLTTSQEYSRADNFDKETIGQSENRSPEKSKRKISIQEIRNKRKKEIAESIDKGIEPGLSMAASGENMSRGLTKTKLLKKPLEELTGDDTTASIGAQKEDELKKVGISLTSFKKRNFV